MKMIASTKMTKAQRAMQAGKAYGLANSGTLLLRLNVQSFIMACRALPARDR